ncbi:MAG: DPP IV N-terminal domain-containing protein [Phycisphaerales bacterium]
MRPRHRALVAASALLAVLAGSPRGANGETRFDALPGHDRWKAVSESMGRLAVGGRVDEVRWLADGSGVDFQRGAERMRLNFATRELAAAPSDAAAEAASVDKRRPRGGRAGNPARGRQLEIVRRPDDRWDAICRDNNVLLQAVDGAAQRVVTSDGTRQLGYGRASWVYGEELDQTTAMWWSPDSSRLAFYEFDNRNVIDFPLPTDWTAPRPRIELEAYPKPGEPNPVARLQVYELAEGRLVRIDVGPSPEQYIYAVQWTPDGSALLFNRTNRRQDTLELVAADPRTGDSRVVLTEKQPTWQENRPQMRFLADGKRFIWETERTGWNQYELRDLSGQTICALTRGDFPVLEIVHVDEPAGWLYYTAASGDNRLSAQLHRVRLDGTGQQRLTRDELHHTKFNIAPDNMRFVCTSEAIDTPPATGLYDMEGNRIAWLAQSDTKRLAELGLAVPERFTFKAADGATDCYGILYKPSNFDPAHRWPVVVDVYGGPGIVTIRNTWVGARPETELGFLVAQLENRGTPGRGKAFESATYLKLGQVDLDDQAAGVRALAERPYIDASRVGITGGSYGGYMSAMALLRHPDVFRAAVAVSAVTDWRNYDTIYTERYMRLPAENTEGYDAGSAVKLAANLKGRLLLMHGMVDDNVHPNNVWQLVNVLQEKNIPFRMMFFPNDAHGVGGAAARSAKWGFLWDELVQGH